MTRTEYEGRLFIDGEFREARSSRRYDVINPADESVVATAADAGPEDVHDAVTAARRVADETSWGTDHKFRRHCLEQLQAGLRNEADEFRKLVTAEAGVASSVIVNPRRLDDRRDGLLERPDHVVPLGGRARALRVHGDEQRPPNPVPALRRRRGDHPVECPVHDRDLEGQPRDGHR